jgi:hypothetical protein
MNRTILAFAFTAIAAFASATSAQAQTATDTETFRVVIQPLFSINAPAPLVVLPHDESNNNQVFPPQNWLVTSNNAAGATVTFETNQAFTHTVNSVYQRNASLGLSIASGNSWTVNIGTAQTDYAAGNEVVAVTAESNRAGAASFLLDVRFIEETFTDLAAGDYEMTVTGTLTAK